MARTDNLTNFLTDVADAIRVKKGTEETILASDFDTEIENLPSGGSNEYNMLVDVTVSYTATENSGIKSLITEIGDLDTSSLTGTNTMFAYCYNLKKVPLLNTSKVTGMNKMFYFCSTLKEIPLLDTSRANYVNYMFSNCVNLTTVPKLDCKSAKNMSYMFNACEKLTSVVFGNSNICIPTNVSNMFAGCKLLTHIDLRDFSFTGITNSANYSNMFGASATQGVPNDCEIIVADDTQKTWITNKFSRLTNVKTVAELE